MLRLAVALLVAATLPAAAAPIKGYGPSTFAVAYGSVWIGMSNGDVLRYDARTGRRQARFPASSLSFVHGLSAAYGGVWAVRGRVVRVDPRRDRIREVPGVESQTLFAITPASGALWLADDGANEILRIDGAQARLAARIPVSGRAWGVAAGNGDVVVVSVPQRGPVTGPVGPRLLRRLDVRSNRLSAPLVRLACDAGIAFGPDAVWTFDFCNGVLARRDPTTLRVTSEAALGVLSQKPVVAFGSVWLASRGGVLRVDPVTLRVTVRIRARSLMLLAADGYLWALDPVHFRLRKIDPRTDRVVAAFTVGTKS